MIWGGGSLLEARVANSSAISSLVDMFGGPLGGDGFRVVFGMNPNSSLFVCFCLSFYYAWECSLLKKRIFWFWAFLCYGGVCELNLS